MKLALVLSSSPCDGTDRAWNGLRLALTALEKGGEVTLFLINDGMDIARKATPPEAEFDIPGMLEEAIGKGAKVLLCGTCLSRCGLGRGETVPGAEVSTMDELYELLAWSDRAVTF